MKGCIFVMMKTKEKEFLHFDEFRLCNHCNFLSLEWCVLVGNSCIVPQDAEI